MIRGLNSFRFFAFLAVFLFHATDIFNIGYLGVMAFFVLSGFLITPILVNMKNEREPGYFTKFYGRRVLRIFPLYYFYLAFFILLFQFDHSEGTVAIDFFSQIRFAVLYVYDFFHASSAFRPNPFLTPLWTLAVEEQFYLLWPIVIFFTPLKYLRRILIFTIILSIISRVLFLGYLTHQQFPFLNPNRTLVIYALPTSHFEAFALGGLFAIYVRTQKLVITLFLATGFLVIGMVLFKWRNGFYDFSSLGYPPFMLGSYRTVWGYSFASLVFASILVNIRQGIFFPRIFNNKTFEYLGKISYGLYIYHAAILHYVHKFNLTKFFYVSLSLLLTIFISILSYEFFEKKFLILKDKLFPVSRVAQPSLLTENL